MSSISAIITTSKGEISLTLIAEQAPLTVANFVNLSQRGYYDGLTFHRVIENFMIQGGCPEGTGTSGPGYQFEDEFDASCRHDRPGILSMANAGPGTNGSQFFITHTPTDWLDDRHSVFGAVDSDADQEVVNEIVQGDQIESVRIQGDVESLIQEHRMQLDQWNTILDEQFSHLKAVATT